MRSNNKFTLKIGPGVDVSRLHHKQRLCRAHSVAGAIQGSAPTLSAPSNSALHAVDLSSNATGAVLASGDTITLTYTYNDADEDLDNSINYVNWYYTKGWIPDCHDQYH